MASITKPVLLAVIGILAVVLFLQTSNLITGNLLGSHDENLNVTLDADIGNGTPSVSGVTLVLSSPNNPCGTDTVVSYCEFTVDDENGVADLAAADVNVWSYFGGVGSTCTANDSKCYTVAAPTCTNATSNATRSVYNCTFSMEFFAQNGTWSCNATVSDQAALTHSGEDNDTRGVLRAINLAPGIDWTTLSVGDTGMDTNDIRNCGNRPLDSNVNASTMTCDGTGSVNILAGNITVGPNSTNMVTMSGSLGRVHTNMPVEVDGCSAGCANQTTYWNLTIPSGVSGSCSGTAYVVGIEDQ